MSVVASAQQTLSVTMAASQAIATLSPVAVSVTAELATILLAVLTKFLEVMASAATILRAAVA